jgi:acetylornithine deacetylase
MKTLIQQLITISSISGQEQTISDFVISWLEEEAEIKAIKIGNGNIAFCIEGEDRNQVLIFNAHLDTVNPGNISDWAYQPFGSSSGVIKGGKIYGLGASDEKAGVAALLLLAKKLITEKPLIDVWFTFVTNEEIDGNGTKEVMKYFDKQGIFKQYQSIAGVICEPTGLSEIQIAHKGNVFLQLSARGDAGHGSEPEKIKINAIDELNKIIQKIIKLGKKWQNEYSDGILGTPTVSLTGFQAGDINVPNSFPSKAVAIFDIRTIPEMHSKVVPEIKRLLKTENVVVSTIGDPAPPGLTHKNNLIVSTLKKVWPKAKIASTAGSTDMCFFSERGISAVIFGPGEIDVVHKPNEFCYLRKIGDCVEIYNQLIMEWAKL